MKSLDHFNICIRFLISITLAISLLVSGVIFIAFFIIQKEDILTDFYLLKYLMYVNILPILTAVSEKPIEELSTVIEKIYLSFPSIHYITISNSLGDILFGIPEDYLNIDSSIKFMLNKIIQQNLYNQLIISDIDCHYGVFQGKLLLEFIISLFHFTNGIINIEFGLFCNTNILFIVYVTRRIVVGVFVAIWLTALFTIILNFFVVGSSIKKINLGLQDVAKGNFSKRIEVPIPGDPSNLIFCFNEMAERLEFYEKKNVEQLTLEKLKLETLVSIIADGAILLDKELRIIFINQSASKTFKFLKSCIIGTYIFYYFPPHINEQLLPILNKMIDCHSKDQVNTNTHQLCITFKTDVTKTFQFIIATVLDSDNKFLTGIAIIIQDITNQISLDEAKAQFISNVSHELRTPLFNIRSFLETLSEFRDSLTEKQQIEFLDIANQETQRLTYLVNDVLDLSRLESDFLDAIEVIELYDIIPPAIQTSQLRANEKSIELSYITAYQIYQVSGYTNLLIQVISNLIGNSLKFTTPDGRIIVKVYGINIYGSKDVCNVQKVRIEVIDEGCGIREFDHSRIFDRFVRLENNVHTLEGTGLGLSIVKNIIDKHNSQIYVYSELGAGSSFWFDLFIREKKN